MRTDGYRRAIYEAFAQRAKAENLPWIVLHGIEGYPESIGRDLDAYCKDRESIFRACEIFEKAAKEHEETLYVIYPNPLWGKRVLAVSKAYEVAELHILYRINSGIICCNPDFNKVVYLHDFPYEDSAVEFKSIVMSLLGSNPKVLPRMEEKGVENYAPILQTAYWHLKKDGRITGLDRLRIYLRYMGSVSQAINSVQYAMKVKKARKKAATVPIVAFENFTQAGFEKFKDLVFEVFTGFRCGDEMTIEKMIHYTARQELVYLTSSAGLTEENVLNVSLSDEKEAAQKIVAAFDLYNADNRMAMFDYK